MTFTCLFLWPWNEVHTLQSHCSWNWLVILSKPSKKHESFLRQCHKMLHLRSLYRFLPNTRVMYTSNGDISVCQLHVNFSMVHPQQILFSIKNEQGKNLSQSFSYPECFRQEEPHPDFSKISEMARECLCSCPVSERDIYRENCP